jgi:hypothetical protein
MGVVELLHDIDFSQALLSLPLVRHVEDLMSMDKYLDFLEGEGDALLVLGAVHD